MQARPASSPPAHPPAVKAQKAVQCARFAQAAALAFEREESPRNPGTTLPGQESLHFKSSCHSTSADKVLPKYYNSI